MFWVVQNNIFKEQKHSVLMKTLKQKKIPHLEVKVVPFSNDILPSDFDSHNYYGSIEDAEKALIPTNKPIMVLGGTTLGKIAEERGWKPGSFLNDNFHYNNWLKHFGDDLLNKESMVDTLKNINPVWDEFFIRPCEDTKDFAGTVYTKEEFDLWRNDLLEDGEKVYPFINNEVVASPVKEIYAEYRFFIVDGKIVTQSQYKKGDQLHKNIEVGHEIINFTNQMLRIWQPAKAFVIDIAETRDGLKVIEINNFNSAGFYAADVVKIIEAIENLKEVD